MAEENHKGSTSVSSVAVQRLQYAFKSMIGEDVRCIVLILLCFVIGKTLL